MPGVADKGMEQLVDDKVEAFWKGIEGGANKRGQIVVTFSEKKPKKSWFQVYTGEEEVPWEYWVINAEIRQPKTERDRQLFEANLTTTLSRTLQIILTHTSSETGRAAVPLMTNSSGISPFPFRLAVKVAGVEIG